MPNEEKMTLSERRKYLRLIRKRYLKASNLERGRLVEKMEAVTCLHRKSGIRLMSGSLERKHHHRQRGRTYGPNVDDALRVISESLVHICAERLQPNPVWIASHLADHGETKASPCFLGQPGQIRVSARMSPVCLVEVLLEPIEWPESLYGPVDMDTDHLLPCPCQGKQWPDARNGSVRLCSRRPTLPLQAFVTDVGSL
jgi:hypothetical protein